MGPSNTLRLNSTEEAWVPCLALNESQCQDNRSYIYSDHDYLLILTNRKIRVNHSQTIYLREEVYSTNRKREIPLERNQMHAKQQLLYIPSLAGSGLTLIYCHPAHSVSAKPNGHASSPLLLDKGSLSHAMGLTLTTISPRGHPRLFASLQPRLRQKPPEIPSFSLLLYTMVPRHSCTHLRPLLSISSTKEYPTQSQSSYNLSSSLHHNTYVVLFECRNGLKKCQRSDLKHLHTYIHMISKTVNNFVISDSSERTLAELELRPDYTLWVPSVATSSPGLR